MPAQLTDDELLLRCAEDPEFFARMVLPAAPSQSFRVGQPFEPKWWQGDGLRLMRDNKRITLRIRRQTGKTIFSVVYCLWCLAFAENHIEVLVVAPQQHHVETWYQRFCHFIDNCPFLAAMVKDRKKTPNLRIEFENGCFVNMIPGGHEGTSIRSKSADVLFIDEADYLTPGAEIAVAGLIKPHTKVIATTTISGKKSLFYRWVNIEEGWVDLHIHPKTDPDFTDDEERQIRSSGLSRQAYAREVECVWTDADVSVYTQEHLETAVGFAEWSYDDYMRSLALWPTQGPCFMGVDWDKYGAGSTLLVLQLDQTQNSPTHGKLRVIWREEVPRTEYSLSRAVERVIFLSAQFGPMRINCDRGYGEHQVETLQEYGLKNPISQLHERVHGIAAQEKIELIDPMTGGGYKKPMKAYMVARSQHLFEQGMVALCKRDDLLVSQLSEYEVVDAEKERYSNKNDHCVDALNLAILAYCQVMGQYQAETQGSPVIVGTLPEPQFIDPYNPEKASQPVPIMTGNRNPWNSRGRTHHQFAGRQREGRGRYLTSR